MPADPRVHAAMARLGTAHRRRTADPAEIEAARTALNEAKVQVWAERALVECLPNLSRRTEALLTYLACAPEGGAQ